MLPNNLHVKDSYKLFIDGKWCDAQDGATFKSTCPATGDYICSFAEATKDDVDKAVKAAMSGQSSVGRYYHKENNTHYIMTMSQVIHPGYCCITYQELDALITETEV